MMTRARGAALAAALSTVALTPAAHAAVTPFSAGGEGGSLSEFSQYNTLRGSLGAVSDRAYQGTRSFKASSSSTSSTGGYSRGVFNVNWANGDDVWYGMALYLPTGFKAAMRGGVDLARWDNWPTYGSTADYAGIKIWNGDKKLHIVRGTYDNANEQSLLGGYNIPEGRWVWLEAHQKMASTGGFSELWMDGKLLGRTGVSSFGRPINRLRFGVVSLSYSQTQALTLWFDRATVSGAQVGPTTTTTATQASRMSIRSRTRRTARQRATRAAHRRHAQRKHRR